MKKTIINLTQHAATPDQVAVGVVDVKDRARLSELLTCDTTAVMSASGSEYLRAKAAAIITEFVRPVQLKQADDLLGNEWSCGSQNAAPPLKGVEALNAVREAFTIHVMVGGAPYLVDELRRQCAEIGVICHYALSERVSEDVPQPDGSVKKIQVFKHAGFYPPL